jgi:tetratricopeptide (TPR) repeat protein
VLLLLAVVLAFPALPVAADESEVRVLRASALARQGRCEEALALLRDAPRETASVALLRGQCQLQLRRYPDAVASLEWAHVLDPSLPDVDLNLAMARFHLGDLAGARAALAAAEATSSGRAEYQLYRGLLLLQEAELRPAAAALERARDLNPDVVEPTASYYAGLAWASAAERARAEEALQRVEGLAPGSVWADEARRARERLADEPLRFWAWVKLGMEYDDNVVLRASSVVLPREISSTRDWRGVWQLHAGYELLRSADWSAGVTATYYGSAHIDLDQFDQHYPVLGLWLDRRFAEATTLRFRYDAGYAWVDQKPFVFNQALTSTLFHDWGRSGRSELVVTGLKSNYFFSRDPDVPDGRGVPFSPCPSPGAIVCGPPGIDESRERNRSGLGVALGGDHAISVPVIATEFTTGYRYSYFSSRGREYTFQGHEVRLETRTRLPWDLHLRNLGSYTYAPYRHASTFPDPRDLFLNREYPLQRERRRDDIWFVSTELEKYLTPALSMSVRYSYLRNRSSVAVFDYERKVAGIYVTYRFGR